MTKADKFWKNLDISTMKSREYGIHNFTGMNFKDYTQKENKKLIKKLNNYFSEVIQDRDNKNIDRYITAMDCSGMSILIHRYLKSINIPSILMIGDMLFDGKSEYDTSYQYLENELRGKKSPKIQYHVWVIVENFMLIDPTIRLKELERQDFLDKKINAGALICDIENIPNGIEYIPFLQGELFLHKTNPNPYI
jgi:hypothetical protein